MANKVEKTTQFSFNVPKRNIVSTIPLSPLQENLVFNIIGAEPFVDDIIMTHSRTVTPRNTPTNKKRCCEIVIEKVKSAICKLL